MNQSDWVLVVLLLIMTGGVIVARRSIVTSKSRLLKVCSAPAVGQITNIEVMKDTVLDDMADIYEEYKEYKGRTLIAGLPYIRYEYNGKNYEKLYRTEYFELLDNDELFSDGFRVPLLVNPNNPRQFLVNGVVYKGYDVDVIEGR